MLSKKSKDRNLKAIRDALMTQKKLATITKIHEVRLSRGLRGEVDFSEKELERLSKALGIELILNDSFTTN